MQTRRSYVRWALVAALLCAVALTVQGSAASVGAAGRARASLPESRSALPAAYNGEPAAALAGRGSVFQTTAPITETWLFTVTVGVSTTAFAGPLTIDNGHITGMLRQLTGRCHIGTVNAGSGHLNGDVSMTVSFPACNTAASFEGTLNYGSGTGSGTYTDTNAHFGTYVANQLHNP